MLTSSELKQIKDYLALYGKRDGQLEAVPVNLDYPEVTFEANDYLSVVQDSKNKTIKIKDLEKVFLLTFLTDEDFREALKGKIPEEMLENACVTTEKLADGAVTTIKLGTNAVTTAKIADGAVTGEKIANNTIQGAAFAANSITSDKIVDNTVTGDKLADGSIQSVDIKDNTLSGSKFVDGSISGSKIQDNAIESKHLLDNSIPASKIKDGSIESIDIKDGTLDGAKIKDDTIEGVKFANNAITSDKIVDSSIDTSKISNNAVTEAKIVDDSITTNKIANSSVTTDKIADEAITENKLANGAITTDKLADGLISEIQNITDATPTIGSVKPVQSGGVKTAIDNIAFSTNEKVNTVGIDNEPTAESNNLVKSGGVQNELVLGAVYDVSAKNPTAGPNNDGKWESLSALLSDANLNTLIPTSVRKGGMSIKFVQSSDNKYMHYNLIADAFTTDETKWSVADAGVYVENPEFLAVKLDADKKILWGIRQDGTIYYGAGVPPQVSEYINTKIDELSLDEYEDIVTFLGNLIEGDTLATLLNDKADKVIGKSLIDVDFASSQETVENPEWMDVKTDNEGKVLGGRGKDGKIKECVGIETKEIKAESATLGEVTFEGEIPQQIQDYVNAEVQVPNIDEINHVKTLGAPIALMNYNYVYPNGDIEAKYNYLSVLRKTPSLIYLYYGVTDRNRNILNDNFLKIAYCDLSQGEITNPNNWHRDIPSDATKTPSQKWQEWYNQQTIIPVEFNTDTVTTRLSIPESQRYAGMFITYNNGNATIVERYGYECPPEGGSWNNPITPGDSRTYTDIYKNDDYWINIENIYNNSNYPYFEDLYGDPIIHCYGGGTIQVPDSEYPYRSFQIASMPIWKGCVSRRTNIFMWKSKDGIIFEKCRYIDLLKKQTGPTDEWFEKDGTVEPILHGDIIKLYIRWRPYTQKRQVGEEDVDLEGNLLSPGHHLFGEDNLYIPAVSRLDYRRDILFPTYVTSGITAESIKCFIRDNNRITEVTLPDDFSENGTMLSQYVGNNALVSIQNNEQELKQYIIYEAYTWAHDLGPHNPNFHYEGNYAYIKIREIKLNVQ